MTYFPNKTLLRPCRYPGSYFRRCAPAIWACSVLLSLCLPAVSSAEDPDIRAFHDRFFQAWNAGDLDGLVGSLTEDTIYHPMNAATIRGRETLARTYEQFLADYAVEMIVAAELLEVDDDRGTMMGLYRSTMTPASGDTPIVRSGRYYMELRKGSDGFWRISRELTQPTKDLLPGSAGE